MASVKELRAKLESYGVDPDKIPGSGAGGSVLKSDLEAALARVEAESRGVDGLDDGPKVGSAGQYLPARYKTGRGSIREDR